MNRFDKQRGYFEHKISLWVQVDYTNIGQLQPMFSTPLKLTSKVYLENVYITGQYDLLDEGALNTVLPDLLIVTSEGSIGVKRNELVQENQVVEYLCDKYPSRQGRQQMQADHEGDEYRKLG